LDELYYLYVLNVIHISAKYHKFSGDKHTNCIGRRIWGY